MGSKTMADLLLDYTTHDGSMVLLYMVLHGSHQYTPFLLALIYQHHGSVMGTMAYSSG